MSPFCGATDTPVLDFWWCLLWVSKPEWVLPYLSIVEAYVLHYTFPEIHLWCDTCWPLGGQHGSWAVSSTYLQGIGGSRNWELSCRHSQCEIRQTLYRLRKIFIFPTRNGKRNSNDKRIISTRNPCWSILHCFLHD